MVVAGTKGMPKRFLDQTGLVRGGFLEEAAEWQELA